MDTHIGVTWSVVPGLVKGVEDRAVVKSPVTAVLFSIRVQHNAIADHGSRNSDSCKVNRQRVLTTFTQTFCCCCLTRVFSPSPLSLGVATIIIHLVLFLLSSICMLSNHQLLFFTFFFSFPLLLKMNNGRKNL